MKYPSQHTHTPREPFWGSFSRKHPGIAGWAEGVAERAMHPIEGLSKALPAAILGPEMGANFAARMEGQPEPYPGAKPELGFGLGGITMGAKALTTNKDILEFAQALDKIGVPRQRIWEQTLEAGQGYAKDPFGNWGWELPDVTSFAKPQAVGTTADIRRVYEHPELFKGYPQLEEFQVTKLPMEELGAYGSAGKKRIWTTPEGMEKYGEGMYVHELSHPIQAIEGWPGGTSTAAQKPFLRRMDEDEAYRRYRTKGGEAQAFNAERRLDLMIQNMLSNPEQTVVEWQKRNPPWRTMLLDPNIRRESDIWR